MTAKTANQPVELITGPQRAWAGLLEGALQTCGMTVYAARRLEQLADLASLGDVALHMDVTQVTCVQAAMQGPGQKHGEVEVLIINGGFGL